jgi:glycosyltransferase involved in cell wall biosynthesis
VDDNSDPAIVDFTEFPGLGDHGVEVFFSKEGKGAGYARNVGLTHAKGQWVLFADSDDYFHASLNELFDKYKNSSADLIVFRSDSTDSVTLEPKESRGAVYNEWLQSSVNKGVVLDEVRYCINPPWAKFFSRKLIQENQIFFDEVFAGNDIMFSVKNGHFAKKVIVDLEYMYCATYRSDSLDSLNSFKHIKSRFDVVLDKYRFLQSINKTKYRTNIASFIYVSRKIDQDWSKNFLKPSFEIMKKRHILCDFLELLKLRLRSSNEKFLKQKIDSKL